MVMIAAKKPNVVNEKVAVMLARAFASRLRPNAIDGQKSTNLL